MFAGDRSNQCPRGFSLVPAGPYCAGKLSGNILPFIVKNCTRIELQVKSVFLIVNVPKCVCR